MLGDSFEDGVERADAKTLMRRHSDAVVGRLLGLQHDAAAFLMDLPVTPIATQDFDQLLPAEVAAVSFRGEHFVANKMQANAGRLWLIEEVRIHRLADVRAQLLPRVRLRDDTLRQALGDKPAVGLLRHLKDDLVHGRSILANSLEIKQSQPG
jgi:hypothetical protein